MHESLRPADPGLVAPHEQDLCEVAVGRRIYLMRTRQLYAAVFGCLALATMLGVLSGLVVLRALGL